MNHVLVVTEFYTAGLLICTIKVDIGGETRVTINRPMCTDELIKEKPHVTADLHIELVANADRDMCDRCANSFRSNLIETRG